MELSVEDLMALWRSVVDPEYARPLLETPDSGIELFEQLAEQLARASRVIEKNRQEMFVRHSSAATYPPAGGEAFATVVLNFTRVSSIELPIVFDPGVVLVEEVETDYGPEGGALYGTKRRYGVPFAVFLPGTAALSVEAIAERPGDGYNIPPPNSIERIHEFSVGTAGDNATVVPGVQEHRLLFGAGDVVPPAAVGQYVSFYSGVNAGTFWRVVSYQQPNGTSIPNGAVGLAATGTYKIAGIVGTFQPGEPLEQGTAQGVFLANGPDRLMLNVQQGVFAAGVVTGLLSGASATITSVDTSPNPLAETATAGWQLLGWSQLGFRCTNPESPQGGRTAVLDHIGSERLIGRSPGEADEAYRDRIIKLPDTVAPNAIVRAMNRVLAPYGVEGCFREPGDLEVFPGMFYDTPNISGPYAYAYDLPQTPDHRWQLMLSLEEARKFFFITLPRLGLGEFGAGYDEGGLPFYDSSPELTFYDGFPVQEGLLYRAVWDSINAARMAGVGFVILPDPYGCP